MLSIVFILALVLWHIRTAVAQNPSVIDSLEIDSPTTGFSIVPDSSRIFLLYNRFDGSTGPLLVERYENNSFVPYPSNAWNSFESTRDAANTFVNVAAQRIGPDGQLWVLDNGLASNGTLHPAGAKLVTIDISTNKVTRIYPFADLIAPSSLLDDFRFNRRIAYLTDAGAASIIVIDLVTGTGRRLLENQLALKQYMPTSGEGSLMRNSTGGFNFIYVDQLEVSPDGQYLYFQPTAGGMSRIPTKYLNQALRNTSFPDIELEKWIQPFSHTPSTGSTAIDARGNIYLSDTDRQNILRISPDGKSEIFVHDSRLLWVDGMWLDGRNRLWLPAAQFNRAMQWHNGTSQIEKPIRIFTVEVDVGPSPLDHA
ncbi:major royal jelly protein [Paecilomyces variotii]|uniref:Major royal jelly protein n=1 Tax=Byssochlamys spectabilis TaxID=264951 RepID=A0A443HR86_BYSSP|nr:major royal jelly protein [Paecilomyces variotii]KAJ9365688.1 hypothetical protein DTO280E4_657 [Paecilomyces variotii]RWQ94342.1 major royal jelly protein [Paecilomyces variotii]